MPTSTVSISVSTAGVGTITIPSVSVTTDGSLAFNDLIPAATTNKQITLAVDVSSSQLVVFSAEGLADGKTMTVKTNSSSSPIDTFTLTKASPGVVWYTGAAYDNPLTTDVTSFYVSSDDTAPRRLRIFVAADVTP